MEIQKYLLIDDPLERMTVLTKEITEHYADALTLSRLRTAALVEAYENKVPIPEICKAGGFGLSRFRELLNNSGHQKTYDYKHLTEATRFKAANT